MYSVYYECHTIMEYHLSNSLGSEVGEYESSDLLGHITIKVLFIMMEVKKCNAWEQLHIDVY